MAEDTEVMDVSSPAMPDVEELRMLRALVYEGIALARHGRYVARFHRWIVLVSREGRCRAGCLAPVTVEIRHPHGELLERACLVVDDRADRAAER